MRGSYIKTDEVAEIISVSRCMFHMMTIVGIMCGHLIPQTLTYIQHETYFFISRDMMDRIDGDLGIMNSIIMYG
jgi:hypothetical protein